MQFASVQSTTSTLGENEIKSTAYNNIRRPRANLVGSKRLKPTDSDATNNLSSASSENNRCKKRLWDTSLQNSKEVSATNKYSLPLASDLAKSDTNINSNTLCDFRNSMIMKNDYYKLPVIVCPTGHLYLEMMHESSKSAEEFLITVAEPMSRPEHIQEFQITVFSLYAAIGIGITIQDIIKNLDSFSKNVISQDLIELLEYHGNAFGRVKIVLRNNRYFLEATTREDLEYMLSNPVIAENRIRNSMATRQVLLRSNTKKPSEKEFCHEHQNFGPKMLTAYDIFKYTNTSDFNLKPEDTTLIETSSTKSNTLPAENVVFSSSQASVKDEPILDTELFNSLATQEHQECSLDEAEPVTTSSDKIDSMIISNQNTSFILNELKLSSVLEPVMKVNSDNEKSSNKIQDSTNTKPVIYSVMKSKKKTPEENTQQNVKNIYLFEIKPDQVGRVKECALAELRRPLLSEYDFVRDFKNPLMEISLKTNVHIRYYQERALRKMFSNGRARSGIIVLPCGAGKTLTGITAASTIRRSAIVLTSSSVAVDQWRKAFLDFTTIDPSLVVSLTSDQKKNLPEGAAVLVSTYTMMAYSGKRSVMAERILNEVREREWGLLIFDEVQFAPAPAFRKLGLTATLVREDDLIHDLQWLIGPKLYEANWLELQEANYLAKVQVSEVWCPMTADFYREYLVSTHAKQRKLWVCNPNKLRVCEYLIRFHESRNDKIIVFGDNLFALKEVALTLKKPFISGEVSMQERDNAIDIPCANVVIQFSFNFASRRQEAQRLGRILRPKPASPDTFNAFFYSLISKDTQEMLYADKRQQFIIDQGYAYKVLPITVFPLSTEKLIYDNFQRQKELLLRIISTNDQAMDLEDDDVVLFNSKMEGDEESNSQSNEKSYNVTTTKTSLSSIVGF